MSFESRGTTGDSFEQDSVDTDFIAVLLLGLCFYVTSSSLCCRPFSFPTSIVVVRKFIFKLSLIVNLSPLYFSKYFQISLLIMK